MKSFISIITFISIIFFSQKEEKTYVDSCGSELFISGQDYFYDNGQYWSKGKLNWKDGQADLIGRTIYDTIVKHRLPDGTDSIFNRKDFIPIVSLDSIYNRTHTRDISQVACCGGQMDSFKMTLKVISDSLLIRTNSLNSMCDTFKLKNN